MRFQPGFRYGASPAVLAGALLLLSGETDGFAIDATTYPPTVAVIDTGTPANNLSNVDFEASNLTNSGTSPKMVHHASSPYVRWSPHNMFLNSGTPATQNVTLVVGFVYTVTVTGAGGGNITGSAGASGTATTGSPATFTASTTSGTFTLTGSLDTIQLNRGAIATAYLATAGSIRVGIPHSYDAAASLYGVLVEPQVQNIVTASAGTGGVWDGPTRASVTANATTAPDGTSTASKLEETTDNGTHTMGHATALTNATVYTWSMYAKAAERTWAIIDAYDGSVHQRTYFELSGSGTVGTNAAGNTSTITSIGDGWYRCTLTRVSSGSGANGYIQIETATADNVGSFAGTLGSGFYVWGIQVEQASYATSIIPTVSAVAVRGGDLVKLATSTIPSVDTAHSFYMSAKVPAIAVGNTYTSIDDGSNNNRIQYLQNSSGSALRLFAASGGGTVASLTDAGDVTANTTFKAAYSAKVNDFMLALNGVLSAGDTSGAMPVASMTQVLLDHEIGSAGPIADGSISFAQIIILPRDYTDGELTAITT
jgi:hypothetical protein